MTRVVSYSRPAWALAAAAALLCLSGCGLPAPGRAAPDHRLVVVLLDETGSFVNYWQPCLDLAASVASRLKPGDAFAVIGIDDHGNDPEDARIPVTLVSPGALQSLAEIDENRYRHPHGLHPMVEALVNVDKNYGMPLGMDIPFFYTQQAAGLNHG